MGWLFWQQKREEPSAPAAAAAKADEAAVAEPALKKKICCACPETKVCWHVEFCYLKALCFNQALSCLRLSPTLLVYCFADSLWYACSARGMSASRCTVRVVYTALLVACSPPIGLARVLGEVGPR